MTARRFVLVRNEDITGRSGVGIIGEGVAWTGGTAGLHWLTDYESFVHWPGGIDAILAVHGHEGATVVRWIDELPQEEAPPVELADTARLLGAYRRVTDLMTQVSPKWRPVTVKPHPDHPDRLRVTLAHPDAWDVWIRRLDGSPHAAVHEEVNGETEHRWVSPDGSIWLAYYTPLPRDENPLQRFHEEDR